MSIETTRTTNLRRRLVSLVAVLVVVAAAAALAFARLVPATTAGAGSTPAAGSGSGSGSLTVGALAPALTGTTLDGATLNLADLRGKAVVVNFWASWCPPCKREFPAFKAVLTRHAGDGLAIVGVLFNDGAAPARAFVQQEGATWPTILDPSGSAARTFEVFGAPETFLIDRNGVVRARLLGDLTESSLEQAVGPILQ